jgi:hypothetical protein
MSDWSPVEAGKVYQINRVDPAFTRLALGHERLGAVERFRHLHLRQAGVESRLAQPSKHCFVARLVNPSNVPH